MELIEKLEELLNQKMGKICKLDKSTTFEELGLDSYEVVDFALILEDYFDITFFDDEIHELHTVEELIKCIESHTN